MVVDLLFSGYHLLVLKLLSMDTVTLFMREMYWLGYFYVCFKINFSINQHCEVQSEIFNPLEKGRSYYILVGNSIEKV